MTKKQPKKQLQEESIEAKPRAASDAPVSEQAKQMAKDAVRESWEQMFSGTPSAVTEQLFGSAGGELVAGEKITLTKRTDTQAQEREQEVKEVVSAEHMEYFRTIQNADKISENKTENEVKRAVEEIRMEIKRLRETSKIVEQTVKDATADKAPVKPGKYHISFFQFVLSILRDATRKLEDTASYGAVFSSRKQQSKYWNKYKKHGTMFGLSGERTTATQTG